MADFMLWANRRGGPVPQSEGAERRQGHFGSNGVIGVDRIATSTPRAVHVVRGLDRGLYVVDGQPWNTRQLAREMGLPTSSVDPATVLAEGWRREGEAFLPRFRGPVVGAVWQPTASRLSVFRDKLGQRPIFFFESDTRIAVSADPGVLLTRLEGPFRPNRGRLAALLAGSHDLARDYVFEDLYRVLPREVVTWNLSEMSRSERRYWTPERGVRRRAAPVASQIRDALFDAVAAIPGDAPAHTLSGGLDSSSIVAVDKTVRGAERPIDTFSMVAPAHEQTDETKWVDEAARTLGVHNEKCDISEFVPLSEGTFAEPRVEWGPMYLYDETWWKGFLRFIIERGGPRDLVFGLGGDRVFGGPFQALWDAWRRSGRWIDFARATGRTWGHGGRLAAARSLGQALPLASVRGRLRQEWRRYQRTKRPWRYPGVWVESVDGWRGVPFRNVSAGPEVDPDYPLTVRMLDNASWNLEKMYLSLERRVRQFGMRIFSPLLDGRLWELCLSAPVWKLRNATCNKLLLREAVEGLLPDSLRCASGHTDYRPLAEEGLGRRHANRVDALMRGSRLVELGLIDRTAFLEAHRAYVRYVHSNGERASAIAYHLWSVVATERWLRDLERRRPF